MHTVHITQYSVPLSYSLCFQSSVPPRLCYAPISLFFLSLCYSPSPHPSISLASSISRCSDTLILPQTSTSKHEPRVPFQAKTDSFEVLAETACTVIGPHLRTTRLLQGVTGLAHSLVDGEDQPALLQVCIVYQSDWRPEV